MSEFLNNTPKGAPMTPAQEPSKEVGKSGTATTNSVLLPDAIISKRVQEKYSKFFSATPGLISKLRSYVYEMAVDSFVENYMKEEKLIESRINDMKLAFRNGRVGEEYVQAIQLPADSVIEWGFNGLDQIGLKLVKDPTDPNKGTVSGSPTFQGDTVVTLWYKPKGWEEGARILERKFPVAFNPDPKTLWLNKPTPTTVQYYKPDQESQYVGVPAENGEPRKDIVVASLRGRSHANEGIPRDDHFGVKYIKETGWYILAVADGAGSAKFSRKGSWIACDTVLDKLTTVLSSPEKFEATLTSYSAALGDEGLKKRARSEAYQVLIQSAWDAKNAIYAEAAANKASPRDYATTLLVAVCKKFAFGWVIASYWVGDGALAIYQEDADGKGRANLLGVPDGGEYAGQTRFLTMQEVFQNPQENIKRISINVLDDFKALFLMTDGVSDPKFETDARLNNSDDWTAFWKDLTAEVKLTDDNEESQYQLLKWLEFWSPGNHDDRTIAILY